jgi:DNA-binding CsgD family transcriptional regulator
MERSHIFPSQGNAMWLVAASTLTGNLPFRLGCGEFVVGRSKRAQIVLAEATVSRKHATLAYDGTTLTVRDLESANGTFINEAEVSLGELKLGDHVRFGSAVCAISITPLMRSGAAEDESTYQIPLPKPPGDTTLITIFTPAQRQIIPLLKEGKSESDIAALLNKSRHTIHAQIRGIFERMEVHSREELIVKLMRIED